MRKLSFQLKPVPPFRLDLTVWALRRRPHNLVDRWDGQTYRRVLLVHDQPVEVAVSQTGPPADPLLRVEATNSHSHWEWVSILTTHLVKMLGLHADLGPFYRQAEVDEPLRSLAARWRGLKPPRYASLFEALVNAIACQQVSLTLAVHLLNRLASRYGLPLPESADLRPAFPRPADLAGLDPGALRALGFSRAKEAAILALAREPEALDHLGSLSQEEAMSRLLALRGVGRWSAEYVLLRGLGRWSVFPGDDAGARRALKAWLHLPELPDHAEVRRQLNRWHPYGGLIYLHFLLNRLGEDGLIS